MSRQSISPLFEVVDVTIRRAGRTVVEGLSLAIDAGEVVALVGPNGAGKSTLLGALSGELPVAAGHVRFAGRDVSAWPPLDLARRRAVLPQHASAAFAFRGDEIVALGRLPHHTGPAADATAVMGSLAAADAAHLAQRSIDRLSGGEQQRLHLARAICQVWYGAAEGPCALLLDEPTTSLDPAHQHSVLSSAAAAADRGMAVVVVLHDLNLAARYADRVVLLSGGRIVAHGPPAEVLTAERVEAVFGLPVAVLVRPGDGRPVIVPRLAEPRRTRAVAPRVQMSQPG